MMHIFLLKQWLVQIISKQMIYLTHTNTNSLLERSSALVISDAVHGYVDFISRWKLGRNSVVENIELTSAVVAFHIAKIVHTVL